ncbi:MAG: restriction endonuclease subunit S [Acidimicrobiales bacterium]
MSERASLDDLVRLKRGYDLPSRDRRHGDIPILGSFGVTGWHDTPKIAGPGVTVGRSGASIGVATYHDGPCWPLNTALYVQDFKGNDPRYVYFVLDAINFGAFNSGAAQPSLNRNYLGSIDVWRPSIELQRRVSRALGAFDDLIENNRRRIAILEEMARLLYREWFVHFRYPGHEDIELADSELGPVPEGWEIAPTGDVFDSVGGGTPSKKESSYWDEGDIDWFTPSDLTKSGAVFMFRSTDRINRLGLKKSSAKLFPAGSVMMTSRATVGEIAIAACEAATNQGFITCVPNHRVSTEYLYLWLHSQVGSFLQLAGGATFKELRKSDFRDYRIALPPETLMRSFDEVALPQFDLIANLIQQNRILRECRDLLLPRLVSGELDVSELDLEGLLV